MSKWGNIVNKVKAQASVAGAQAQTFIQVGWSGRMPVQGVISSPSSQVLN